MSEEKLEKTKKNNKGQEANDKSKRKKERNDIKMKKRVLFVLLTIVLILPFIKVKAGSMDSYVDWTLDRSVFAHQYRNGSDHITNLAMMTTNGVTAYCIEPGITADKASYYSSTTNIYDTKLVNVNTKKLSLIGLASIPETKDGSEPLMF